MQWNGEGVMRGWGHKKKKAQKIRRRALRYLHRPKRNVTYQKRRIGPVVLKKKKEKKEEGYF